MIAGETAPARLRRPAHVAEMTGPVDEDGIEQYYLAPLPNGPLVRLSGTAALIWRVATSVDDSAPREGDLSTRIAADLGDGVDPDTIRSDVEAFVADLLSRGLLERC